MRKFISHIVWVLGSFHTLKILAIVEPHATNNLTDHRESQIKLHVKPILVYSYTQTHLFHKGPQNESSNQGQNMLPIITPMIKSRYLLWIANYSIDT